MSDRTSRLRAGLELALLFVAFQAVLWTDNKRILSAEIRTTNHVLLGVFVVGMLVRARPRLHEFGLAPRSWFAGLLPIAGATAVGVGLIAAFSRLGDFPGYGESLGRWASRNWHLEGVQQVLLQVVVAPRFATMLSGVGVAGGPACSAATGLYFGALHAPNPILMPLTFLAGFFWVEWFRVHRNLAAVWISHFVLALATIAWLDGGALRHLRVGVSYLYFRG